MKNFVDYCSYFHNGDGHAFAQIGKRWQVWESKVKVDDMQIMWHIGCDND